MTVQGMEMPSRSLGVTHLTLLVILIAAGFFPAGTRKRRLLIAVGVLLLVVLPVRWVGPLWTEPDPLHVALPFYNTLFLSLAIPFGLTVLGMHLVERRAGFGRPVARAALTVVFYFVGLLVSYPVSFNYALLYPLIR